MSNASGVLREENVAKTHWTPVAPDTLRAAQERLGYTDREMAERLWLGVEKTWWRWRTEGRVPTTAVPAVARVLGLPDLVADFDRPAVSHNGEATGREVSAALEGLTQQVAELQAQLARMQREEGTS